MRPRYYYLQTCVWILALLQIYITACKAQGYIRKSSIREDVQDLKDFKKLLRTRTNVLVMFISNPKEAAVPLRIFRDAAEVVRGTGTTVLLDCSLQGRRKLCKHLKAITKPYCMKHYKDGSFHKDYTRQMAVSSIYNFMRDPTGDLPWEEEAIGKDVVHFTDYQSFKKHLTKDTRPMLLMFHVPWCSFCKRIKGDFSRAATELKSGGFVLAGMDVERTENAPARKAFNITGFPMMLYFEKSVPKKLFDGEPNKDGFIAFMKDPNAGPTSKLKESDWSEDTESEIVHLTTQSFEPAIKDEESVLIMFYAPWCGHCKQMKPEYEKAATTLKDREIPCILAALDASKDTTISEKFHVKGFPTLKYFVRGEYKFDITFREADKIVEFMLDPKEPPVPTTPPPETPWEEEEPTNVVYLNEENFIPVLKRKKHALVMFYAPWCGHCKSTKPEFIAAAAALASEQNTVFCAVDCTRYPKLCTIHAVRGYPTLKYFSYFKQEVEYTGGRHRSNLIAFVTNSNISSVTTPVKVQKQRVYSDEL
ncbi:protein disulfide-isomerase A5 [Teleopsis dalmanni]|uniref:protein disulfide-isomerase A5 n=1 Tax=Teleopsis dalmanni TaxID=139649 RepID=UPI0018CD13C1|nr:protein disulfide-isomerase A5 [Teleopsis dalmanni]